MTFLIFYVKFITNYCNITNDIIAYILLLVEMWLVKLLIMFLFKKNKKFKYIVNLCTQSKTSFIEKRRSIYFYKAEKHILVIWVNDFVLLNARISMNFRN